ncbi:MAG: S-methyl-5'-thioinosine phosphorylase [Methylococcales bacterium]|jgi:5'-methylthioinosine phosphorylase|nr:S-methyl-5'-thioinosine phosphorylase [Methylococcales bacterium]MBT7409612.1 S-methyl-5'-thioinosine phosphorylase [Methylococcales bacterium]
MNKTAIIGGTGLTSIDNLNIIKKQAFDTPFGSPSAELIFGQYNKKDIIFLPRHGENHTIPPHKVNYRANIWALKQAGVQQIIAVAAVGGIHPKMGPGTLVIPNQIIDYTYGRSHTFFESELTHVTHIDFTTPYSTTLRDKIIKCCQTQKIAHLDFGTYGATQGPRLETAAEIKRMQQDGCDLVGMTGMPEASLAREQELDYASCSIVANWGAGLSNEELTMEMITQNVNQGLEQIKHLLREFLGNTQ